jgi:hypothetical protein
MTRADRIARQVKQIAAEMSEFGFRPRVWTECVKLDGNAAGGHMDLTPACAGAAVYDDILEHCAAATRGQVSEAINRHLLGHKLTVKQSRIVEAVVIVATARVDRPRSVSKPELPPDAWKFYKANGTPSAAFVGAAVVRSLQHHAAKPFGKWQVSWVINQARLAWRLAQNETK